MQIHLLAVGTRPAPWVSAAFQDYVARLPRECALRLTEVPTAKRTRNTPTTTMLEKEGARLLAAVPVGARVLALDRLGESWDSRTLSAVINRWMLDGRDVALLVGGPDGLAPACLERAESCWSLSPLTLPHGLVRVVIAEQLYRACSLLRGHPYHR
jgi:23S rRNA (pseudouridine1915-N3)-methyltransferase